MNVSVSFVIPIFNQSPSVLVRCLKALKYIDKEIKWEAIIIDDGSFSKFEESYKKIIKKEDKRVKYFYKKNGGVSSARNFGIKYAQNEYIIFVDVDDMELTKKVSSADFTQKSDLIIYNVKMRYLSQKKTDLYSLNEEPEEISYKDLLPYLLKDGLLNWVFGKCYKREFLLKHDILFNETIKTGEDFDFNYRILNTNPKIKYISKYIYIYNYDENSDFKRKCKFPRRSLYDAEHLYQLRINVLNELKNSVDKDSFENELKSSLIDSIFYSYLGSIVNKHEDIYNESLSLVQKYIDESKLSLGSIAKLRMLKRRNHYELRLFFMLKKVYRKLKPYNFS